MIATWYWTIVVTIGFIGALRNLRDRTANLRAVRKTVALKNGKLEHVATVFRNSEFFRMTQTILMWIAGVVILYVAYFPKIWPSPYLIRHLNLILNVTLCGMATVLTFNIFYFGREGRSLLGKGRG